jgi:uncharacterized protein (TIGR02186 family)
MRRARAALVLALLVAASPACAERLVISLSTHRVLISSNFTGVDLTLFGAIEVDASAVGRSGGYAVVATVTGPPQTVVTWRKERIAGIWVNTSSRTFVAPPSFLSVLTNRPIDAIASPEALRRFKVGLRQFLVAEQGEATPAEIRAEEEFRQALVRVKSEQGLYREQTNAVTFLTPALLRAAIPLPANVPVGEYEVAVKLFSDGVMIAQETSAFEIIKVGFEQYIAQSARDHSLLYGLATAALALLTGWLGAIVFRRD